MLDIKVYEPTNEDLAHIRKQVKNELKMDLTAEEHTEDIQNTIEIFLDKYLVYNPDNHVACAYKPNYEDPLRTPLYKKGETQEQWQYRVDEHRRDKEFKHERNLIPPDDTFFRWKRYTENHYEELRQATDDIYAEKSDIDFAILPYYDYQGKNSKADAHAFERKYSEEVESDILQATYAVWNFLGPWAQNRAKRHFYTEQTEIIKRIIDQHQEDEKFGKKLMRQRMENEKKKDDRKHGPMDSSARKHFTKNPSAVEKHGAKNVDRLKNDEIREKTIPRDNKKSTKDEIEVGVHVIKPVRRGRRRIEGKTEQWKFHIPAENELPKTTKFNVPGEFKKELEKNETQK
jgi:hypothetical protein